MKEGNTLNMEINLVILPLLQPFFEILTFLYWIPNDMLNVQMLQLLSLIIGLFKLFIGLYFCIIPSFVFVFAGHWKHSGWCKNGHCALKSHVIPI